MLKKIFCNGVHLKASPSGVTKDKKNGSGQFALTFLDGVVRFVSKVAKSDWG